MIERVERFKAHTIRRQRQTCAHHGNCTRVPNVATKTEVKLRKEVCRGITGPSVKELSVLKTCFCRQSGLKAASSHAPPPSSFARTPRLSAYVRAATPKG
eukprot:3914185-Pleurochrysis_carterae.AAC.1